MRLSQAFRTVLAFITAPLYLLVLASPLAAMMAVQSFTVIDSEAISGSTFYRYGSGQTDTIEGELDWDEGVHVRTKSEQLLELELDWHLLEWQARRCWTFNNVHPDAVVLTERPYRLELDTETELLANRILADGGDVRAVAVPTDDLDPLVELPLWVEGPMDREASAIWVQVDNIPLGESRVCLYWNNPNVATVSDKDAVFTFTVPQPIYHTVSSTYTGAGAGGRVRVASFVDNNIIEAEGVQIILDEGQTGVFNGLDSDSVISSTGPLAARGGGAGSDSVVPVSFAGTEFVLPVSRYIQSWSVKSPFGDADIEIYNGNTLRWNGTVTQAGGSQRIVAEVNGDNVGVLRVTNDVPVLVVHVTTNNSDGVVLAPYVDGDDLYGVRSRYVYMGASQANTDVTLKWGNNVTQNVIGLSPTDQWVSENQADRSGNGTALRITNIDDPMAAMQQADRDGFDSTQFHPESLLSDAYILPTDAEYIAFACPDPGTVIDVGANQVTCTNADPGHPGHAWIGATAAGTIMRSTGGERFYAYYEDDATDDETNLFGSKIHKPYAPAAPDPVPDDPEYIDDLHPYSGTWTDGPFDLNQSADAIFGVLSHDAVIPDRTRVRYRLSTSNDALTVVDGPFLGPDGTTDTYYEGLPLPIGHHHDGDQFLAVEVTLTTMFPAATPQMTSISFGNDLVEDGPEALNEMHYMVDVDVGDESKGWLARIWLATGSPAGDATLRNGEIVEGMADGELLLNESTQLLISPGQVDDSGEGAVADVIATSVGYEIEPAILPARIDATWGISVEDVLIERDLVIRFE